MGFTAGNLTNLAAIPVITAILAVGGFYYLTNYRMEHNENAISKISETVVSKTSEDTVARNKIRDEFLAAQMKTAEGIAKLDTRLAVAETTQKTQLDTLTKISDTLQRFEAMPSAIRK